MSVSRRYSCEVQAQAPLDSSVNEAQLSSVAQLNLPWSLTSHVG